MTRPSRRRTTRAVAIAAVAAGIATAGLLAPDAEAASVAAVAVPTAGEALCIDLSPLKLPSSCVGSLL